MYYIFEGLYLEFTNLGVKRKCIKDHWADEGDVSGLAVVDPLASVNP